MKIDHLAFARRNKRVAVAGLSERDSKTAPSLNAFKMLSNATAPERLVFISVRTKTSVALQAS